MTEKMKDIDSTLKEKRLFKPSKDFQKKAHIKNAAAAETLRRQAQNP